MSGHAPASVPGIEHLETVLDAVSDAVFTVDRDFVITRFNRAAERLTGLRRAAVIGRRCHAVFGGAACAGEDMCPLRLAQRTGCVRSTRRVTIPNGRRLPVPAEVVFRALRATNGEFVGGVETIRVLSGEDGGLPETTAVDELPILEATERRTIEDVLRRHDWNRVAASQELGISRVTLWRKMRKLGIDRVTPASLHA